jgi:peptidyl-prolyl cis-trans isomerase C
MKTRIFGLAVCFAGLIATTAIAEEINPVVGKMGDFVLREADLERLIASQSPEVQKRLQEAPEQKVNLVRELFLKKAVAAKAKKDGFDRKPETREQLGYVIDDFLSQQYVLKVVVANVTVPDEELKKYYQEHEQEFQLPEMIKVRHIFFEAPKEAKAEDRDKAKARAEAVLQRLKKGEDFAKLAEETSDEQESGKKGGDLGTIAPGKTSSEEFEKAAFALKAGETSGVVDTAYGYHIIKVDERQEKRIASLDEAREFIRKKLQAEFEKKKAQEFVEQAMKDSGMEVFAEKITGKKEEPEKKEGPEKKEEPKK